MKMNDFDFPSMSEPKNNPSQGNDSKGLIDFPSNENSMEISKPDIPQSTSANNLLTGFSSGPQAEPPKLPAPVVTQTPLPPPPGMGPAAGAQMLQMANAQTAELEARLQARQAEIDQMTQVNSVQEQNLKRVQAQNSHL